MTQKSQPLAHDPNRPIIPTEIIISGVLRGGVIISGSVILIGLVIFLLHREWVGVTDLTKFTFPYNLGNVFNQAFHGSGRAIIMLGLVLLIATPVSRIAISVVTFALERDWRYVAITALVLAILLLSFTLGKAGG